MDNCKKCCFVDYLGKCETDIRLFITLPVYGSYRWVISDRFDNKYQGNLTEHADGGYVIPVSELPAGMLTQYGGRMRLQIFPTGESVCGPVPFYVTGQYDCIDFDIEGGTFEKNNLGCETPASGEPSYLEYIALLFQEGGADPVATVITNTLGGTVVWSYQGAGSYHATLAGAFPENKTFIAQSPAAPGFGNIYSARQDNNTVAIITFGDDALNGSTFINIRVYP